ncbi:AraC family transcriptional regulator [Actinomadura sp. WMMA1423]|uniref:helix-turn-helix domain-containing protein n=1 Tax=Actinomadura sp. WMMA1423 TaxID=2591108 RepID=UPI00114634E5|nr:helix-turn-helix domain-containing protein [Actinomadura sp. WMMA1423]
MSGADSGWAGTARLERGVLTFTGRLGGAAAHAHAAVQVVTLTSGTVVFQDRYGHRLRATSAIIPAGVVHTVDATGQARGTTYYLDPAGRTAAALAARVSAAGDRRMASTWIAAAAAPLASPPPGPLHPALAALVRRASQGARRAGGPDVPESLAEAAAEVGLSITRLGHLFTDQLGLPYTAWRRWARLQHAMAAVHEGATLTEAAHAAGFTDSAHLTRVCRAMFGITPTQAARAAGWPPDPRSARRSGGSAL